MGQRDPCVGHLVSGSATAVHPLIRVRVIGVTRGVVVPLLDNHDRTGREQRRHVILVKVALVPSGAPVGDHADDLRPSGLRIEELQRSRPQPQMPVGLEAVDANRMVEAVEALSHGRPVGRHDQLAFADPIEGQSLLVIVLVVHRMEPDAQIDDVTFDHVVRGSCSESTGIHVNVPANESIRGDRPANAVGNDLTQFTHGVLGCPP